MHKMSNRELEKEICMIESILKFIDYKIIDLTYSFNDKFSNHKEEDKINLPIALTRKVEKNDDGKFKLSLILNIGKEDNSSPFSLKVTLAGLFEVNNNEAVDELIGNATAILYPYLRSIVSGITGEANIAVLTLPIVNVAQMFADEDTKNT